MAGPKKSEEKSFVISPPKMHVLTQQIVGTAPLVQCRCPEKARDLMRAKHEAGSTGAKGKKKEPRDFEADFQGSMHRGPEGQYGIPAPAFRAAAISACRLCGFKMTLTKLALFIEADFFDQRDGTPLVQLYGEPKSSVLPVRNATGVADLRARAMWLQWSAKLRIRFDADVFAPVDVINLLRRVGDQVGIGEGRPDSRNSAGMGWGLFALSGEVEVEELRPVA